MRTSHQTSCRTGKHFFPQPPASAAITGDLSPRAFVVGLGSGRLPFTFLYLSHQS
jgi:hypothetical protein